MRLFYSYSQRDQRRRARLEAHLAPLQREGLLDQWHDRCIVPGADFQAEIDRHLEEANLILLLISPEFIASDYCYKEEARRALARHAAGVAWVIPVMVRPVDYAETPIARLHALPKNARPVSTWRDPDRAWLDVAQGIRRAIAALRQRRAEAQLLRTELSEDAEGTRIYLSSELFGFTKPWRVSLALPAGAVLDSIQAALKLPPGLDHGGRIGMSFEYHLVHKRRQLARTRTLSAQGVQKEDVLELQVNVRPFAASQTIAVTGEVMTYRGWQSAAPGGPQSGTGAADQTARRLLEGLVARAGW